MSAPARYHPLLVALHWAVGLLILGNLAAGFLALDPVPNSAPEKQALLRLHMASGLAILALLVVRLVVRLSTKKPVNANADAAPALRWLATANHWALYLLTAAMVSTGLGMAQLGGLFPILGGQPVELPTSFSELPPYAGHGLFATLLLALIGLHVAAVAYHHLVKRQNLLARMWFGRR
jgi:cytochrome b561